MSDGAINIRVRRKGNALIPVDRYDREIAAGYDEGAILDVIVRRRRSRRHTRLYWARLDQTVKNTAVGERWPTAHNLHKALLQFLGFVTPVWNITDSRMDLYPDSTKFDKMSQADFSLYVEKVRAVFPEVFGLDWDAIPGDEEGGAA